MPFAWSNEEEDEQEEEEDEQLALILPYRCLFFCHVIIGEIKNIV